MIDRQCITTVEQLAREFKILAVTGPRQSGKTTLCRMVFPDYTYFSLEDPDSLQYATEDPRGFLAECSNGAILDEAQRCPPLFSYLQGIVDQSRETGQFILTGSQQFGLNQQISQSLAGRVGFLKLLPFSYGELDKSHLAPKHLNDALFQGGYPPLYDQPVDTLRWLNAYIATYVERDVRHMLNVRDLKTFQTVLRLCAGSMGSLLNLSRIGADAGVDQKTVRHWVGLLEASFIVYRLHPHHSNFRKRVVKTPKLYFYDTGLVCRLLGIESAEQLSHHVMRGALFENWVLSEFLKERSSKAREDNLFFWRSNTGLKVDFIAESGGQLNPIEVKSGRTIASDWFTGLRQWVELAGDQSASPHLVYGGSESSNRQGVEVHPWNKIQPLARSL